MKAINYALTATLCLGLAGTIGCSSDETKPTTTPDSGVPADTGVVTGNDAGVDAGATADSGPVDTGTPPVVCMEDMFAGNHARADAQAVTLGDDYANLQICSGVDDFFKITLTEGQRISIGVFFNNGEGDLDVQVFAPGAPDTVFASGGSTDDNEVVAVEAEVAGEYTIRILGFEGAEALYQLDIVAGCILDSDCSAPDVCHRRTNTCGDNVEPACGGDGVNDPNGSDSQAIVLDLTSGTATVTGLKGCTDDLDFFTFDAIDGDSITVQLTPETTADGFAFLLVNAEGQFLPAQPVVSPDVAPFAHLTAGTWGILVISGVDPEEGYEITVTKTAGACTVNSDCATNPVGTFCLMGGACGALEGNGMTALGALCDDNTDCAMDADFCDITSVSPDGYMCNTNCEADADCTAVGMGGYCSEDRGVCDLPCAGDHDMCAASGYCADSSSECISRACNFGGGCDAVSLDCQWARGSAQGGCAAVVTPACGQGGVGEPNNTVATATPLTMAMGTGTADGSICDEDSDIYSFVVSEISDVQIAVTWAGAADVDFLVVPTGDNRAVGAGFGTEANDETTTTSFLAPGTYYVVVGPWEIMDTPDMDYTVTVTRTAAAAACSEMTCLMTEPLRQTCDMSGACVDFDGAGAVAIGGECDDLTDCVSGADLCFIGQTMVFNHLCSINCAANAECEAAIPGSQCFDLGNGTGGCGMP